MATRSRIGAIARSQRLGTESCFGRPRNGRTYLKYRSPQLSPMSRSTAPALAPASRRGRTLGLSTLVPDYFTTMIDVVRRGVRK